MRMTLFCPKHIIQLNIQSDGLSEIQYPRRKAGFTTCCVKKKEIISTVGTV